MTPGAEPLALQPDAVGGVHEQTAVVGTITGAEFGAPPPAEGEQESRTTGELVTSYGVVFDLGEVIGWFAHR